MAAVFCKGDEVYVFYRMTKRSDPRRKFFATLDQRQGSFRPRTGLADGFVPALVVEVVDDEVRVEYRWPFFFTQRGHLADSTGEFSEWYPASEVRPAPGATAKASLTEAGSQPDLALITFRWGGVNEVVASEQWGETGSSVSDTFIDSFVDTAVLPKLGCSFEVWTVYIEDRTDMIKIADSAHLIFGPNHPAMRARHTCAMYHLYPTGFEENCIPSRQTGEDGGAALVDQKSLFRMIQAVERAGIPTRFPHPSGFYELLTSKRWTYMMSLTPSLRVPPTISMPRMLVEQGCPTAAKKGLVALQHVKDQQAKLRGEPVPAEPIAKGVAKLGYSWEALDVKFWQGQDGLKDALFALSQTIEISQEITGQPHDLETILVQEYCQHDLELRLYIVEGKVESTIYTKFCKIKENLEFGDFMELFSQQAAAGQWMGNDLAALVDGERQCREITAQWLVWVEAQISEPPPAIRFDFFVGRAAQPGKATVWTLEICELGFSMLGEKGLPAKVFRAMLRSCLDEQVSAGTRPETAQPVSADTAEAEASASSGIAAPASSQEPGALVPASSQEKGAAPAVDVAEVIASAAANAAPGDNGEDDGDVDDFPDAPEVIHIVMPRASYVTEDQMVCAGKFHIMKDMLANNMPIWEHENKKRWLYFGAFDNYWYVGDEDEREMEFDCDQGYIRHEGDDYTMPSAFETPWERGPEWEPDEGIAVNLDGSAPSGDRPSKGTGKAKGKHKTAEG